MISVASSLNVEVIEIQEVRVNSGNPQVASASKHPIDCDGLRKVLAQGTSVASALHVGVFEINSWTNLQLSFLPVLSRAASSAHPKPSGRQFFEASQ